ncbi:MAG: amino acid adenylation domain-containing protein [Caldicoprobacterales bacterium]
MQRNVLEYLENIVVKFPEKVAYADGTCQLTFKEVYSYSRAIGTFLIQQCHTKEPIVVFMSRRPETIVAYYGVVYSGCCYVPIDEEMPRIRIELIFKSLNPSAVICDENTRQALKSYEYTGKVYLYEDIIKTKEDTRSLMQIRNKQLDIDPLYIVFTSGSTGTPKGVVACHRSVIDYIDGLSDILKVDENTVFGNQTPLYVDACLKELYPTLKVGATAYIIPKDLFMFPIKLADFMNKYKINTICWVVSALTMISAFGVLEKNPPKYLHTIAFGSEVFPIKQFNLWRRHYPNARMINLYGPTETTGMACYYEAEREFAPGEVIPIGRPFPNTEILLLDENNKLAGDGQVGEICIRGTRLTLGYYNDFERTNEVFVQNPLNTLYPETIYRTGDLGKFNENGELLFISRKDNQIKHMGHRIELGEIEAAANFHPDVHSACCIYNEKRKKIVLFYMGSVNEAEMAQYMKNRLPRYMVPNQFKPLETMPLTPNGKIDRMALKALS